MDDHFSTTDQAGSPAEYDLVLDPITAELKIEFARVNQELYEASFDAVDDAIEWALAPSESGSQIRSLSEALTRIRRVLDALDDVFLSVEASPHQLQQAKLWKAAFKFHIAALAKLKALLARSLRATLRVPMFQDGPELSGYKHRLR